MLKVTLQAEGHRTKLALEGRFVFEAHREFRGAADRAVLEPPAEIHVDLADVDYLDSSALGMLLVLNDKAKTAGKRVVLANGNGGVREILSITRMDRLFAIA